MPSNNLLLNGVQEFSVPDSKMEEFLLWLKKNGHPADTGIKKHGRLS